MGSADFIARGIISRLKYELTPCQENMIRKISSFLLGDESDIFVINGYAGTGPLPGFPEHRFTTRMLASYNK